METVKQLIKDNVTLKAMLINKEENEYNKTGALYQISLDCGLTLDFTYQNYHNILQIAKQNEK
jgi:hypothetical protein